MVEVYANILNKQPGDRACTYPTTVSKEGEVTEEVGISMKDREFQFDFKSAETLKHILNPVMEVEAEGVEGETVKVVEEVPVSVQDGTPQPEEPIPEFKGGNDWTELLFPSDDVKFAVSLSRT